MYLKVFLEMFQCIIVFDSEGRGDTFGDAIGDKKSIWVMVI